MKSIIKFAVLALVLLAPTISAANDALLTVRFNQRSVNYHGPLYTAVYEALKTKPTVVFDVVGYSPDGGTPTARQVAGEIVQMGVNPAQVSVSNQVAPVQFEEVKIFVR